MADAIVERLTAVEVELGALGKTVESGFDAVGQRLGRVETVILNQQKEIGESAGRMNEVQRSRNAARSNTNRELNRVWEFLKLPLAGLIGGLASKLTDKLF